MNLAPVENHLWQSTIFAALAWLLVQILRKNSARVRYSVWMLASLKFLFPVSLLIALGGHLSWPANRHAATVKVPAVEFISEPFSASPLQPESTVTPGATPAPKPLPKEPATGVVLAIWLAGVAGVVTSWLVRVRRVREILSTARRLDNGREIEALERVKTLRRYCRTIRCVMTESVIEPGIHGVFRPILLLPSGVAERLDADQLDAIVDHELCHIRWYDNLSALIHLAVEALFWFHPLVWWMGTRLVDERERACDEQVLENGGNSKVYASAILKVCEFYVASPLECVAGVSGGNLRKRIEEIMNHCVVKKLSGGKKLLLASAGMLSVAVPLVVGILNAPSILAQPQPPASSRAVPTTPVPQIRAQQKAVPPVVAQQSVTQAQSADTPKWEVVSIRPTADCTPPGGGGGGRGGGGLNPGLANFNPSPGRLNACTTVAGLIEGAYVVMRTGIPNPHPLLFSRSDSLEGAPSWVKSALFQITAKAEGTPSLSMMRGPMMRKVLEDRFKLKIHREPREVPVYALTVAKGSPKLRPFKEGSCVTRSGPGSTPAPLEAGQTRCKMPFPVRKGQLVTLDAQAISLNEFSVWLGLDRPVVDETGLTGLFDIHLEFALDESTPGFLPGGALATAADASPSDPVGGPSVFTAVQEQLGLKLERSKSSNHGAPFEGPGDVLVIDSVERPSEN